jgi:hypothetical protein
LSYPNPLPASTEFFKDPIVKSRYVARTTRPKKGLDAFAPRLAMTAAMGSLGACGAALHPAFPTSWHQLDRNEDRVHPGEGSA